MIATICTCNPGVSHQRITETDAAKIRRIRKSSLELAKQWRLEALYADCVVEEGLKAQARCAEYTAYQCLLRLRELRMPPELVAAKEAALARLRFNAREWRD